MAQPMPYFMPVTPRTGGLVHAVIWTSRRTECGRAFNGWKVATAATLLSCALCRAAILDGR
jgi:hypothetical protein